MPFRLFDLLRQSSSNPQTVNRKKRSRRPASRRGLAFESLERREMLSTTALTDFSVSTNTGEKPQSKVWEYAGQWYSVMPDSSGTWLWHLEGTQWQHQLQLSSSGGSYADVKVDGDLAHILLFKGTNSQLATVQYDAGPDNRYEMWSQRPQLVNVTLSSNVETATIDLDSTGRMWLASDVSSTVEVRYADAGNQYTSWSAPITVASGINSDDISAIIAMPNNTVGVFWSNQSTDRFGFRVHVDGSSPTSWSADELPASQSALSKGGGIADDHVHLAVASDGTLYAAVKTSYDSSGYPKVALLVRRPSGAWDNLYEVDGSGTRPIVVLNEAARKLIVAYTSNEGGGNILYKESSMDNISFGPRLTMISGSVNNVSSTKQNFTDEVVLIAGGGGKAKGVKFRFDTPTPNQAPTVNAGPDRTVQVATVVTLDATVTDDGKPTSAAPSTSWTVVSGPGSVTFGNAAAVDTTAQFGAVGTYVLRLTASDGQLSNSDTITVVVQAAVPNQPPTVSAGPNQTITLPALANLAGTVTDDGKPSPGALSVTWTRVSGPGTVTFGNTASPTTTAQFSVAGTYVLQLTANDGEFTSFSQVTIVVQAASGSGSTTKKPRPRGGKNGPQ